MNMGYIHSMFRRSDVRSDVCPENLATSQDGAQDGIWPNRHEDKSLVVPSVKGSGEETSELINMKNDTAW